MSETGKRIKLRRKSLGISADELATELGVSRSTVFRYENGEIEKVPADYLNVIADLLSTTPQYLMGWEDDPLDYERIANDEGICPPNYFDGDRIDYIKNKLSQAPEEFWGNDKQMYHSSAVTYEEEALIIKYRSVDDKGKHVVNTVLEMEYNRCKQDSDHITLNAAHDNEATPAQKASADEIMEDDNEWG